MGGKDKMNYPAGAASIPEIRSQRVGPSAGNDVAQFVQPELTLLDIVGILLLEYSKIKTQNDAKP